MKLIGVYGASGFGREIMPLLRHQCAEAKDTELVFVDDGVTENTVNGHKCMNFNEFISTVADEHAVTIGIGSGSVRNRLVGKCREAGVRFVNIRSQNSIVMDNVNISEGYVICPFVTITSNVIIGKHFHANIYSYVAHDCEIGDFVTFAPGVKCNGNVYIEDDVYIGTGAIIRQGEPGKKIVIGSGAVIGMGAVVTRSVPSGSTVIGNPARPLVKGQG